MAEKHPPCYRWQTVVCQLASPSAHLPTTLLVLVLVLALVLVLVLVLV